MGGGGRILGRGRVLRRSPFFGFGFGLLGFGLGVGAVGVVFVVPRRLIFYFLFFIFFGV